MTRDFSVYHCDDTGEYIPQLKQQQVVAMEGASKWSDGVVVER
jgi:hypothetical protein